MTEIIFSQGFHHVKLGILQDGDEVISRTKWDSPLNLFSAQEDSLLFQYEKYQHLVIQNESESSEQMLTDETKIHELIDFIMDQIQSSSLALKQFLFVTIQNDIFRDQADLHYTPRGSFSGILSPRSILSPMMSKSLPSLSEWNNSPQNMTQERKESMIGRHRSITISNPISIPKVNLSTAMPISPDSLPRYSLDGTLIKRGSPRRRHYDMVIFEMCNFNEGAYNIKSACISFQKRIVSRKVSDSLKWKLIIKYDSGYFIPEN